jgi:hypothetical protein
MLGRKSFAAFSTTSGPTAFIRAKMSIPSFSVGGITWLANLAIEAAKASWSGTERFCINASRRRGAG